MTYVGDMCPGALLVELLGALHAVESRLEECLEPLGLSLAKFGALAALVEAGEPIALGALADRCACVRSNITQLVDRLEADKLVVRSDDPHDRRSVRAELTAEGRSRHAAGLRALERAEQEVLSRIPEEDREPFLRTLESLKAVRLAAL
jgi:DNA-binding MarR family transcriptional regulator